MIGEKEPILIKWKISAEERRSQNEPNRKEFIIAYRKSVRATPETRAKSKHDRTTKFKWILHPCSCFDDDCGTPCEYEKKKMAEFIKKQNLPK